MSDIAIVSNDHEQFRALAKRLGIAPSKPASGSITFHIDALDEDYDLVAMCQALLDRLDERA